MSECEDSPQKKKLHDLRVVDLKCELDKRCVDRTGLKTKLALSERLAKALEDEGEDPDKYCFNNEVDVSVAVIKTSPMTRRTRKSNETLNDGTLNTEKSLKDMNTAEIIKKEAFGSEVKEPVTSTHIFETSIKEETHHDIPEESAVSSNTPDRNSSNATSFILSTKKQAESNSGNFEGKEKVEHVVCTGRNLWISGLDGNTTRAFHLKELFSKFGRLTGAKIVASAKGSRQRCYGFVTMATSEDATACVENLNNAELLGRTISVKKTTRESIVSMKKPEQSETTPKVFNSENSSKVVNVTKMVYDENKEIADVPNVETTITEKTDYSVDVSDAQVIVPEDVIEVNKLPEISRQNIVLKEQTSDDLAVKAEPEDVTSTIESQIDVKKIEVDKNEVFEDMSVSENMQEDTNKTVVVPEEKSKEELIEQKKKIIKLHSQEKDVHSHDRHHKTCRHHHHHRSRNRSTSREISFRHRSFRRHTSSPKYHGHYRHDSLRGESRRLDDIRVIERRNREESYKIEKEKERLRIEKEKLERLKADVLRREKEHQRAERERIEHERAELRKRSYITECEDPGVRHSFEEHDNDYFWENRKRSDESSVESSVKYKFAREREFHRKSKNDNHEDILKRDYQHENRRDSPVKKPRGRAFERSPQTQRSNFGNERNRNFNRPRHWENADNVRQPNNFGPAPMHPGMDMWPHGQIYRPPQPLPPPPPSAPVLPPPGVLQERWDPSCGPPPPPPPPMHLANMGPMGPMPPTFPIPGFACNRFNTVRRF